LADKPKSGAAGFIALVTVHLHGSSGGFAIDPRFRLINSSFFAFLFFAFPLRQGPTQVGSCRLPAFALCAAGLCLLPRVRALRWRGFVYCPRARYALAGFFCCSAGACALAGLCSCGRRGRGREF